MAIVDEVRDVLRDFPARAVDAQELEELRAFLDEMKAAGIAKTREYDLPRADTVGRDLTDAALRHEAAPGPGRAGDNFSTLPDAERR